MDDGQDEPTSGEPRSNWPRNSKPRTQRESKIAVLTGLMLLYPDNRLSPEEWKIRLRAYLEEIERFPAVMVEQAIRVGRRQWKFFPSVPEVLEAISEVNAPRGTGGMGSLRWPQYQAWLQSTGRPTPSNVLSDSQMRQLLATISDREMARLGTPRHQQS